MSAQHKWIKPVRLILAFLLAPAILLLWQSVCLEVITGYYETHTGYSPSQPLTALATALSPIVLMTLFLAFGSGVFLMLVNHHLSFLAIVLPAWAAGLMIGLLYYTLGSLAGHISFGPVSGAMSVLGVVASNSCFYFVGLRGIVRTKGQGPTRTECPSR